MKTSSADKARYSHMAQFCKLGPLEQLEQALSAGYLLRSLMSKDARQLADRLRNGTKKAKLHT
jgi:hypothetical protein